MNNLNVLILDSDLNFLEIAKRKLEARGFKVHTSSSASETIKILKENGCDSLLVNLNKDDERKALFECIETLEVKPVILFSKKASSNFQTLEL